METPPTSKTEYFVQEFREGEFTDVPGGAGGPWFLPESAVEQCGKLDNERAPIRHRAIERKTTISERVL